MPLALVALVGVISILVGIDGIYSRLQGTAGVAGAMGLLLAKVALVFQACSFAVSIAAWLLDRPDEAGTFRRHARWLWVAVAGLLVVIVCPLRSPLAGAVEYWLHQGGGAVFGLGLLVDRTG